MRRDGDMSPKMYLPRPERAQWQAHVDVRGGDNRQRLTSCHVFITFTFHVISWDAPSLKLQPVSRSFYHPVATASQAAL